MDYYWYIVAPVGIAFGLFLFFSQHQSSPHIHNLTFTILGAGVTVCLVFIAFYLFLFGQTNILWLPWAVLGVGLIVSIPVCYLSCKIQMISCIIAALPAGVALGLVL
jgi:hypothetical protein